MESFGPRGATSGSSLKRRVCDSAITRVGGTRLDRSAADCIQVVLIHASALDNVVIMSSTWASWWRDVRAEVGRGAG